MKNRKARYAVMAFIVVCIVIVAALLFKQDPVSPVLSNVAKSELEAGTELKVLTDKSTGVPGMDLVAENETLALYMNQETVEVALRDQRNGQIWYSNPVQRADDAKASPFEKSVLSSQFSIKFRDTIATDLSFQSFPDSVEKQQFSVESIPSGIRVTYTLGDKSLGIEALPKFITVARLQEKVLSKLDEEESNYVSRRYYPVKDTPEILERLDSAISRDLVLKKMLSAFANAGYTPEDMAFDNEANGVAGISESDKPSFVIPLEYRLDGDQFLVSVPVGQIVESEGFFLRSIDLFKFFGAANTEQKGYMFVPDGTGALINLNNGKTNDEGYSQVVYGMDENDNAGRRGQISESARLPVFGMKVDDNAWFAIIDKGDGIANISADVSGKTNSYNYAYSSYDVRGEDLYDLISAGKYSELAILTDNMYQGDIQIRYSFLSKEDADYQGMAKEYQKQLVEKGDLNPLVKSENLPFYLDLIGTVEKRAFFLGVPYEANTPMTTFEEAGKIVDELADVGIANVQLRYLGWFNDGIFHTPPSKIDTEGVLGGKKGLRNFSTNLESHGGKLYPDIAFQHIFHNTLEFSPASDSARFVTREVALRAHYNPAFNLMDIDEGIYYLLSPLKLPKFVGEFADEYASLDQSGIALRDLGDRLHSDGNSRRVVFREESKHIIMNELDKLHKQFPDTMLIGGNAYSFPYANHLTDIPMESSNFNIADEEVPFYQMVIHGFIDYGGSSVNLGNVQDPQALLLRMIELGAPPKFTWMYESSSNMKNTKFDSMYSVHYSDWMSAAKSMYEEANRVLADVRTETITNHIIHEAGVNEVIYSNGKSILINYTDLDVTINGAIVEANNYKVGGVR